MRLIISLGMTIIFISCFFIFFTYNSMIISKFNCTYDTKITCSLPELDTAIVFGILVVGLFLFIDVLVVYLIIKTWIPNLLFYRKR